MLKTLACITAVSFFTLYQSYDSYHYDINLTLNVLSFVSTIATPLYFLLSGYIDAGERHTPAWQLGKIRRILLIFIFWFSFFWFAGMHHKGYLIQPWFVIALIVIYVSHPLIDRLIQRPGLMASGILLLLVLIVISINAIRLPEKVQWLTPFLTTLGKTMTGVYILHYLIFGLLAAAIRIQTLGDKLLVIALTLIFSMALSLLLLRIPGVSKLISL
nr:hypothetical protein [Pantoea agglomerans]